MKGAVVRGLNRATVKRKKCRRHYGIQCARPFRQGIDDDRLTFYSPFDGVIYVPGYMSWSIHRVESSLPPNTMSEQSRL